MPAILDRKYEKFQGWPTQPPETRVHVSIDRRGVITLNATCYKLLGKPAAANLYFSRADDMIAIEPMDSARLPTVFPFRPNGTAKYLNSAPFCRHDGIKLDTTLRFTSLEIREGALHLKLSDTVTIKTRATNEEERVGDRSLIISAFKAAFPKVYNVWCFPARFGKYIKSNSPK